MTKDDPAPWKAAGRDRPRVVVLAPPGKPRVHQELMRLRPTIEQHSHAWPSMKSLSIVLARMMPIWCRSRWRWLDPSIGATNGPKPTSGSGVNLGRLGFLAALNPDQFLLHWPQVCQGKFAITDHLMLECEVFRGDKLVTSQIGLNEAAILGGPPYSMLQIDLYVDGEKATTYSCDGLIVSTPVGSTAHNLSAGGPILHKSLQAFVISPISPHTLTMRPVVDTADRVFELVLKDPHATTSVVVDGRVICPIGMGQRIRIRRAPQTFQLASVQGQNDYATLRDKLGWSGSPSGKLDQ